ncbi:hypothetical protein RclHR1_11570001 [Rhizophagus clarus]|uniref:Kinase-like domain-containing protein n=1 Tax=Rhizophagus clarus TaxID=94130 RepID=A0A2Z6Q901_9GLOM|nr:hypothetical protein RclHR1_11570001 [Rhizophagus clarus]GET01077.1 kinase-like domain-containing protein [Rhizophagus clarus]
MSYNNNTIGWVEWIEEAIEKEYLRYYEFNQFSSIQHIGSGDFAKVYRANWKNFEHLAIKSFIGLNGITAKEIVHEIKIQQKVGYSNNVIRFLGITKFEYGNNFNYALVMVYACGGDLRNYLKKNFNKLTWDNKYNLAYQLALGVSCLHNEGIIHRDLNSGSILVQQGTIKLAGIELSKRIDERNNNQGFSLNEKSDVYSVGVLLWELSSSGQPPFYLEGEEYGLVLALEISQGLREVPIPGTPENYNVWDDEPDNRPTIYQVVSLLKERITDNVDKVSIPDNVERKNIENTNENTNEHIDWIEEAIEKEYLQYHDYKQFRNIEQIGTGGFGKVYRVNLKNSEQPLALKSFKSDKASVKKIVNELKILREVNFHNNIIRFHGITKFELVQLVTNPLFYYYVKL